MQDIDLAFISDQEEILKVLYESKNQGSVVGISAAILGSGVFLTAVDNIMEANGNYLIVLKGYDVTGYILERNKIRLTDIRSVCPFKSKFTNPYLKEFTDERIYGTL
jgi:hypothetical protein